MLEDQLKAIKADHDYEIRRPWGFEGYICNRELPFSFHLRLIKQDYDYEVLRSERVIWRKQTLQNTKYTLPIA